MKRLQHRAVGVVGVVASVWLIWPSAVAAQGELAQLNRPRFMQPVAGRRAPEEVDAARIPVLRHRVSLDRQGLTVAEALRELTRQSGLRFAYNADLLSLDRPVGLRASSITVAAALTEILVGTGVDVLLKSPAQAVLFRRAAGVPLGAVVGRVTNVQTGQGVAGAEVFLSGTRWKAATDSAGRYRLSEVDTGSYTLTVRRLGYAKQSRQVNVRAEREDTVDMALAPAAVALDELVTTATGQQRRRDLGNAITTIRADSVMQTAPIRNLSDLLENRVPGMTMQRTSGAPGDPSRIRLRGLKSALRSNDPVVIVDGIRVYAAQAELRSGNLTNSVSGFVTGGVTTGEKGPPAAPSPLDQIDPNIIEKIEVFKGASAATLYGADAANGVIVITTKTGKPGPTRWSARADLGRTTLPGQWPVGYYRWGRSIYDNTPMFCSAIDLTCQEDSLVQFQALNEPDLTVLGQGRRTSLSLGASGGNQALTYSVTGTYSDETGYLKLPALEAERFTTRFNRTLPDWMREPHRYTSWSVTSNVGARLGASADIALITTLTRSEQQRSSLEGVLSTLMGTYVDRVNGIYYRPTIYTTGHTLFPTEAILDNYYTKSTASTTTLSTGLTTRWRPRSWFNASGQAGVNLVPRDDQRFRPAGLIQPTGLALAVDSGAFARGMGRSVIGTFGFQGTLRKPLRWGFAFETNVGANIQTETVSDLGLTAAGLVPGASGSNGARAILTEEKRVTTSVFGWYIEPRLSGQRLSLSAGLRLDGGSAYGARVTGNGGVGSGLLGLPKLNGSWVISEEPWFPFNAFFSSLRLRGAYGQAQVQPGPKDRLRLYDFASVSNPIIKLNSLGNTQLRPERSREFEGGFDADMMDGRISVDFSVYHVLRFDALMTRTLPGSVNGGGTFVQNIGNIRNRGTEVMLAVVPVQSPAVTWSTQLSYARNTNVLTKLGEGVRENKAAGLVEGYPLEGRWAKPILGYADQNGNGVLDRQEVQVGDSLVYMGRSQPAYIVALFSNAALFGGAVQIGAGFNYNAGMVQVNETAARNWVLSRALAVPGTPFAEQAAVIASNSADIDGVPNGKTNYGLMEDVSTLRFNSLSVSYRIPNGIARLLRAQDMRIAVQGANLGLHTTYRGIDPNVNAWSPGEGVRDTGQLPQPRTWQMSIDLRY